ncbi:MAG: M23 family metallopeptidase [Patescibacteria group bacterium]|nr:M23 family metallopeptidase [Patescibacteria group bacterium]
MKKYWMIISIILVIGLVISGYFIYQKYQPVISTNSPTPTSQPSVEPSQPTATSAQSITPSQTPISANQLAIPIADFKARITKKPFGIYITPQTSPVQPERFTGYHTGVDVEYQDISADVPVYAIVDGKVVLSERASGYGGVFVIQASIDGKEHNVLYGHIRPSSLPNVGQIYKNGEQLAVLGTGYSSETDGERRHLHFAVLSDIRTDIRGYVQNQSQLSGWIDPLSLY